MAESNRARKVAELLQQELAILLRHQAKDPRFNVVTITAVDVSPDLKNAKIYFSLLDETKKNDTLAALNKAAGFFRVKLAEAVELRIMPQLYFYFDDSLARADKISQLLNEAEKKSGKE